MFKYMDSPSSTNTTTNTLSGFNIPPPRPKRNNSRLVVETNVQSKRKNIENEYNNLLKRLKSIDNELRRLETENPQLLRNSKYVVPAAILNYRLLEERKRAKRLKEEQNILNFNPNSFLNPNLFKKN